jgi:hypothetical protein
LGLARSATTNRAVLSKKRCAFADPLNNTNTKRQISDLQMEEKPSVFISFPPYC